MNMTGDGLLKSGRMGGGLPDVAPMKPMGAMPAGSPSAPSGQGGFLGGQGAPQSAPPPGPPQGQPQGMQPEQGMGGEPQINHVANNALMILHDEEAGPALDDMISQGAEGAAQAAFQVYQQVVQGYEQAGQPIDEDMAGEATFAVLEDIAEIGMASGSLNGEQDVQAFSERAFQLIGEANPAIAEDMIALQQEESGQGMPQEAPPQAPQGFLGA